MTSYQWFQETEKLGVGVGGAEIGKGGERKSEIEKRGEEAWSFIRGCTRQRRGGGGGGGRDEKRKGEKREGRGGLLSGVSLDTEGGWGGN